MDRFAQTPTNADVQERPHRIAAELLLEFLWTPEELTLCGIGDDVFKRFIARLRYRLMEEGLIDRT